MTRKTEQLFLAILRCLDENKPWPKSLIFFSVQSVTHLKSIIKNRGPKSDAEFILHKGQTIRKVMGGGGVGDFQFAGIFFFSCSVLVHEFFFC